jgi:hypothetical protein
MDDIATHPLTTHPLTTHPLTPGRLAVVLGLAGLLPVPGIAASIAAIVCGQRARRQGGDQDGSALTGVVLGLVGVAAPLLFLFVYCVVLGYPFPLHRYQG